jgi:hypothetical protein
MTQIFGFRFQFLLFFSLTPEIVRPGGLVVETNLFGL